MTPDVLPAHEFVHSLLGAGSASAILDVGCGRGEDLRRVGRLARPETRLVGVDASEQPLALAREAARDDARHVYVRHDVSEGLPFGDGEFDRVMSINLLECIPDRQRLLREVHRVLRPGGRVVFAHWDWDSQTLDGDDKELVREIVHAFGDWKQGWMADVDAWMGRRLWRTFQASGLFRGAVHPFVHASTRFEPGTHGYELVESFRTLVKHGKLAPERYDAFRRAVDELAAADRFFYSLTLFVYVGERL